MSVENIRSAELLEYDFVLDMPFYAGLGGIWSVVILRKNDQRLCLYPLGWCDLNSGSWMNDIQPKISGIPVPQDVWFIQGGRVVQHAETKMWSIKYF